MNRHLTVVTICPPVIQVFIRSPPNEINMTDNIIWLNRNKDSIASRKRTDYVQRKIICILPVVHEYRYTCATFSLLLFSPLRKCSRRFGFCRRRGFSSVARRDFSICDTAFIMLHCSGFITTRRVRLRRTQCCKSRLMTRYYE